MAEGSAQVRFAEQQLDGPFDYMAFKHAVGACGSRGGDIARLKAWETMLTDDEATDWTSPTSILCRDALDVLSGLGQAVTGMEWSGADPTAWLLLRKSVIACNRLVLRPRIETGAPGGLRNAMLAVAFMLDCMGRLSDPGERKAMEREFSRDVGDDFIMKRALPIYMDIVCGRGGAWLAYIDAMGEVSMEGRAGTWWQLRDASAEAWMLEYRDISAQLLQVSQEDAGRFIMGQLSLLGDVYDRWQYAMRKSNVAEGRANEREDATFARSRRDGGKTFADDTAMDMFGYCRAFGASPCACMFDVPRRMEIEVRKERIKQIAERRKAAQERAKKRFRLPRM